MTFNYTPPPDKNERSLLRAVVSQKMSQQVTIDLSEYPLLLKLRDPAGALRTMIDTQYSVFAAQHESQPSTQLIQDVMNACGSLQVTSDAMSREMRTSLSAVSDVVSKLPVLLAKSQTRGAIGETCLMDYLKDALCSTDYQIENTAGTAHSGDILVSKRNYQCLCDAKFYSRKVPKTEMTKLRSDMDVKEVRCGVLVSFESGISGYTNLDLDFFTNERNELCCIAVIGNAKECPTKIEMSIRFLETIWKKTLQQPAGLVASSYAKEHARLMFQDILESTQDLNRLIKDSEQQKKAVEDFHQSLLRTIAIHITRIEERLRSIS